MVLIGIGLILINVCQIELLIILLEYFGPEDKFLMQGSWHRKKNLSINNQFLPQIHFAVCPYLIEISKGMESIFTLNFQKDNQIVGELSTMIYPQIDHHITQLDPLKNVMFFRISKDKKTNYKWALYQRNQNGKEKLTDSLKINFHEEINQLLTQYKQAHETSHKNKLNDSKTLNTSSKINQSTQALRSTQKLMQLRKQIQTSFNSLNSSSGTNQPQNEAKSSLFMRQMKGKFPKSKVQISYMFCIGSNEDQISSNIKSFHLESKFSIIKKSLKKTEQVISTDKQLEPAKNKLQLIIQQLQSSQKTTQNPISLINSIQNPVINLPKSPSAAFQVTHGKPYPDYSEEDKYLQKYPINQSDPNNQENNDQDNNQGNNQGNNQDNNQGNHQDHNQKENNEENRQESMPKGVNIQGKQNVQNQVKQKTLSELTNRHRTSNNHPQQIDIAKTENMSRRQGIREELSLTDKMHKKIGFKLDFKYQKQLIQTTPADIMSQYDPNKNAQKSLTHTDQSYLKLDDVILNGKRVSVSDKSEWMITSKSKTSDYDQKQKSHLGKKNSNISKNHIKNGHSLKNLQLNSNREAEVSLEIISARPKPQHSPDEQLISIDFSNKFNVENKEKIADRQQNIVKLKSIHLNDDLFKLKRKSTAEDFQKFQNRYELTSKPKTMQETTIKRQLKTIKNQLKQGNWVDQDEKNPQQQLHTPLFGPYKLTEQNLSLQIPSMIDETVEITKSGQLSKSNSGNECDPFNIQLEDNYDWGQGLSQIKVQNQSSNGIQVLKAPLYRLQSLAQPYTQKYVEPVKQRLKQNHYYQKTSKYFNERKSSKYIFLGAIAIIFIFLISNVGLFYTNQRAIDRSDPIFKKKALKSKRSFRRKK